MVKYNKVFIAVGFGAKLPSPNKSFVVIGTSKNSDALESFTSKQVSAFNLKILWSANIFDDTDIDDMVEDIYSMFDNVVDVDIEFKGKKTFSVDYDFSHIIKELYQSLSNEEKDAKQIKKDNL